MAAKIDYHVLTSKLTVMIAHFQEKSSTCQGFLLDFQMGGKNGLKKLAFAIWTCDIKSI